MEKVTEGESDLGLKRWLLPAACFAVALIGFGSVQNWIFYSEASSRSQIEYQEAREQIAADCRLPASSNACSTEIMDEAREDQRAEFDLYSQKAMALWTAIMGTMAVIGASLSAVGIYLIWRTWDATREAADNSRRTLRSFVAKERALLIPQKLNESRYEEHDGTQTSGFAVELVNGGQAPGTVILNQWAFISEPFWPGGFDEIQSDRRTLVPDGDGRTPFMPDDSDPSIGTVRYLVGVVTYETLENEKFTTPYSYRLERIDHPYGSHRYSSQPVQMHGMPHHT